MWVPTQLLVGWLTLDRARPPDLHSELDGSYPILGFRAKQNPHARQPVFSPQGTCSTELLGPAEREGALAPRLHMVLGKWLHFESLLFHL